MKILFVDDDFLVGKLKATVGKLTKMGHTVIAVGTDEEALDYLTEQHLMTDLILMDELLSVEPPVSGTMLGKRIQETYPYISIAMCTGTAYNMPKSEQIIEETEFCMIIDKGNFLQNINEYFTRIYGSKRFNQQLELRKEKRVSTLIDHLSNLSVTERTDLYQLLEANEIETILNSAIISDGNSYQMGEILNAAISNDTVQPIEFHIDQYLKQTKRDHIFSGDWKKPETKNHLDSYYLLPVHKYRELNNEIDYKSFDLMLNILSIVKKFKKRTTNNEPLNIRNQILVTRYDKNKTIGFELFKDRFIGRRVAFAFGEHIPLYGNEEINKLQLADVLRQGYMSLSNDTNTDDESKDEDRKTSPVFSTALGIVTNLSTNQFKSDDQHMLFEERQWVDTYGKYAAKMSTFLEGFDITTDKKLKEDIKRFVAPEFYDFSDFKEYLVELNERIGPATRQAVLDVIVNRADATVPQFVKKFILTNCERILLTSNNS